MRGILLAVAVLLALSVLLVPTGDSRPSAESGPEGLAATPEEPLQADVGIDLISPLNYAAIPPGTTVRLGITGAADRVLVSVDGSEPAVVAPPYEVPTDTWSEGMRTIRVQAEGGGTSTARTFVVFVDPLAAWPPDTVPVDVVLVGFEVGPADVEGALRSDYRVETLLSPSATSPHPFDLRFVFQVRSADPADHAALLDRARAAAAPRSDLQARLNHTALIAQRDGGARMDIFDSLRGWEVPADAAVAFLANATSTARRPDGYTFYLMNLSALDDPAAGVDHWWVQEVADPDTGAVQDWWRLEWDNDLNTPMGYPLNAFGGADRVAYIDPTAYQWYLDWAHIWWERGGGPAPYGLQYEDIAPSLRVSYLAGIVNDLVSGLAATLPSAPPAEPRIEIRTYVLSGSDAFSLEDLAWVVSDGPLGAYLRGFVPFKAWEMNTTFARIEAYPGLRSAIDAHTTFSGGSGFIDGAAVWTYVDGNRAAFVPDDADTFEILSVNLLYDNRTMVFAGREFTGLGGGGTTAIFMKTDRLEYGDGTRQKGLTTVLSHETGHSLGYDHQFGPRYRADFLEGGMGYFRNELTYGTFWEDALLRVYIREKLLRVVGSLDVREPVDLGVEFRRFYGHYRALQFHAAYEDLAAIEAITADRAPPALTILSPGPFVNALSIEIRWSAADDVAGLARIEIAIDGNAALELPAGTDRYVAEGLPEGVHGVRVIATDRIGNRATAVASFVVDRTPPALSLTRPEPSAVVASGDVTVAWTAADDRSGLDRFELTFDGTTITLAGGSHEHVLEGLADGEHELEIRAVDRAGNPESEVRTFSVDSIPPTVRILMPETGSTGGSYVRLAWDANDAGGIGRFEVRLDADPAVVLSADAREHAFDRVPNGAHAITVTAIDRAGHATSASVIVHVDAGPLALRPDEVRGFAVAAGIAAAAGLAALAVRRRKRR